MLRYDARPAVGAFLDRLECQMPSSNVCWGIDIGAGAVKAIKLEKDGDGVRVDDFVVVPHKKILSTPDIDEADAMRVALGALMAEYGEMMKGDQIAVAIPGHSSFARFAKLPPVEPKGVANLVRFEAVQQIPFPIEEVEWDYQVFASQDTPDVEVGIFAVTSEKVQERLSLYEEVGMRPDQITLSPVGVYNAIAYDLQFTESTPGTIILDIGALASDLIIAEGGKVWVRTFPLGGHHFTEALSETFKLSYSKAEKLKREAETSKYKRHIFQALKPILSDLVQDVQRSIGYYQDTHPDAKLERLIGVGSTFKLLGLRKLLSQQLKIDVYRLESFKRISVDGPGAADFEAASLNMVTAYGLALQGLGLTPINANLIPVSVVRESVWKRKTPWFVAAAAIGILGAGTSFLRPFLDSQGRQEVGNNPQIRSVISAGQSLQSQWQQVSADNQPKFRADNVARLMDRRGLYLMLLEDINEMLADADEVAEREGDAGAFELHEFATRYLAPGEKMPTFGDSDSPDASGGPPIRGGAGQRGGSGSGGGSDEEGAVGPFGAMEVTLALTSAHPGGKVFFNNTILEHLRAGFDPGRPYRLVEAPRVEHVDQTEVTGDLFAPPGPAGLTGAGPARRPPTPGAGRPRDARPGGVPAGRPAERPGPAPGASTGGGSSTPSTLAGLAPLVEPEPYFPPGETVYRYTVRWVIELLEKPPADAEGEPQAAGPGDRTEVES